LVAVGFADVDVLVGVSDGLVYLALELVVGSTWDVVGSAWDVVGSALDVVGSGSGVVDGAAELVGGVDVVEAGWGNPVELVLGCDSGPVKFGLPSKNG
jgi:hypothetical protein